jgi:hypothetical protein
MRLVGVAAIGRTKPTKDNTPSFNAYVRLPLPCAYKRAVPIHEEFRAPQGRRNNPLRFCRATSWQAFNSALPPTPRINRGLNGRGS